MATTKTTEHSYTGNGSTTNYTVSFEYLKEADVKVTLDHVATTAYTFANATTVQFTTAPANGVAIRIYRDTDVDAARFTFASGSALKAGELNENLDQLLYADQEKASTENIADQAVTTAKIRDANVTTAKLADANITTAKLADGNVTTAKIAADAVNGTKIADDSIDSEHYVDGSIDTAHIADAQITTAKIADDAVTADKLANTSVSAGSYTAADITVDAQGRVTAASNGAISTSEITDAAVTTAKIANANVTTDKIASGAVTTDKIADAELVELSTMGGNTAAALADLTQAEVQILDGATLSTSELNLLDGVTASTVEINQLDGNTLKTTGTDFTSSSQFPSASEIDARITARIDPIGGFEAIANEDSFPATAPPAGTVVSIANANGLAVNGSGVGAGTRAGGGAVVINGFPSNFNSTSLDDGIGLLVIATSTAHTYDFHRVVAKNEDVRQLSSDINDFKARYRIGSSNPTTDNDAGDLFFNTGTSKMLVYNGSSSAWEEVQAIGDFFINTISSASGTGGGSATFNGSAYKFTLSNAPTTAQQLLVSINGVVQKPNSGTSQPSEGFALDGADIILAAAPATGSNAFFITIGSSVSIGTPSANTINNSMVKADAAIAGTKINPSFGNQTLKVANFNAPNASTAGINLYDSGAVYIRRTDSSPIFRGYEGSTVKSEIKPNGSATFAGAVKSTNGNGSAFLGASSGTGVALNDSGNSTNIELNYDGSATFTSNVGIGDSSPSHKLVVKNAGASNTSNYLNVISGNAANAGIAFGDTDTDLQAGILYLHSDNALRFFKSGFTEAARIDNLGRLLVGTTSASSTATTLLLQGSPDGASGPSYLRIASGTATPSSTGTIGQISFTDSGHSTAASIIAFRDGGSWSSSSKPTKLTFSTTANGSSTATARMVVDSSGNVAIGSTTAPDKLNVGSTSNGFTAIRILTSDTGNGELRFGDASNGSAGYIRYAHSGNHLIFARDGVEAMRVSSGGRLLIGTTTTSVHGDRLIEIGSTSRSATYQAITTSTSGTGGIVFADTTTNDTGGYRGIIQYAHSNDSLQFSTAATERVRIDSAGTITCLSGSAPMVWGRAETSGNVTALAFYNNPSSITSFSGQVWRVMCDGDVENSNNAYGSISDIKLKENIVDAGSQWNDIKGLRVRKYNFKESTGLSTHTQIGLVAQEAETVSPGLVKDRFDSDETGKETETVTKSVNYSVLYMKAVKALQEAMTRIETLETQNASLEARLTALEGGS